MSYKIPADFKKETQPGFLDKNEAEGTDMYLIRVPKGFDISKLHGTEFSPSEIRELQMEEDGNKLSSVYELSAFSGKGVDVAPVLRSKGKTSLGVPVSGFLAVNKTYRAKPRAAHRVQRVKPAGPVPMPDGLRVRFTPFGAGMPTKTTSVIKRKTKKRKHSIDSETPTNSSDSVQVHKRRRIEEPIESEETPVKKYKKHKKKREDFEIDVTEVTQYHPVNSSGDDKYLADSVLSVSKQSKGSVQHKKHKKKSKHGDNEPSYHEQDMKSLNTTAETSGIENSGDTKSKKSKSEANTRFSFQDSVFMDRTGDPKNIPLPDIVSGLPDNPRVTEEESEHIIFSSKGTNGGAKKKHSSGYFSADTSLDRSSLDHGHGHSSKKKKKKHRQDKD